MRRNRARRMAAASVGLAVLSLICGMTSAQHSARALAASARLRPAGVLAGPRQEDEDKALEMSKRAENRLLELKEKNDEALKKALEEAQKKAGVQTASSFSEDFEAVWKAIRDRLYDVKTNGVDWNYIGQVYRARVPQMKTRAEFEQLVNRMLGELHVSHTAYYTDDDEEFYMLPSVMHADMEGHKVENIGVMGHYDGAQYVVAGVLNGGPADRAGIQSGDRLLSADGQPFTTAGSFRGKEGKSVSITLLRQGEASPRVVQVTPVKKNVLSEFLDATRNSARIVTVDGRRIGYIHLWTMANSSFKETLDRAVLNKLHDTDGLILDVRDGYGGQFEGYGDVFYRPDIVWTAQGHNEPPHTRHYGYAQPMVLLTNEGTRSAKEWFSYEMKKTRRATLVGSRTAGAFLGAGTVPIGKDGLLELAELGLRVDDKRLEGVGITPDIEVAASHSYTEKDSQYARGVRVLLDAIRLRKKPALPGIDTRLLADPSAVGGRAAASSRNLPSEP